MIVHLLTDHTPGLTHVTVVCGARLPEYGAWDPRAVTCAACLAPSQTSAQARRGVSEKAWLQRVRALARTHGWLTYHPLQSQGSEPGWVDLVCLKPPVLVLAELKTAQGRLTPHQRQWLESLRQVTTVSTHLWRPDDVEAITQLLRSR